MQDEFKRVSEEGQNLRSDLSTKFEDAIKVFFFPFFPPKWLSYMKTHMDSVTTWKLTENVIGILNLSFFWFPEMFFLWGIALFDPISYRVSHKIMLGHCEPSSTWSSGKSLHLTTMRLWNHAPLVALWAFGVGIPLAISPAPKVLCLCRVDLSEVPIPLPIKQ